MHLAFYNYYNPFDLQIAGVENWPFRKGKVEHPVAIPDGFYAISVNLLYEFPWSVRGRDGKKFYVDHTPLAHLRTIEPVGRAGYSIRVFSAQQMRKAYASPPSAALWAGFDKDK